MHSVQLVHQQTLTALALVNQQLGLSLIEQEIAQINLIPTEECVSYPELSVDAQGEVEYTQFDDGDLFGFADIHSHLMSHLGFGSGVHGAPFHRLGVPHALKDCTENHGENGDLDLWGYFNDGGEVDSLSALTPAILSGRTPGFGHNTDGYPTFTDWPNAPYSSTHQTQYYRWIERAWTGGLRLIVQHAVSNQVICELQSA